MAVLQVPAVPLLVGRDAPPPVPVHHYVEFVAYCFAYGLEHLHVVAPVLAVEAQLHRAEALAYRLLRRLDSRLSRAQFAGRGVGAQAVAAAAEQPVNRLTGRLADDVPERDLDRPDASDEERHRAQVVDVLLEVERVLAHQEAAGHVPADRHAARPDARDPFVGVYLDDVDTRVDGRKRLPGRVERPRHRHLEQADAEVGDLHGGTPSDSDALFSHGVTRKDTSGFLGLKGF